MVSIEATGFDYPALLRASLVDMVRRLIDRVAQDGFPGDHHFLLTFGTSEPGVVMSPRLRKRYPEEITIVLQHQFWNLEATDDGFQVTLRFSGNPEPLTVPWSALREFADPSAGFGLRLGKGDAGSASRESDLKEAPPTPGPGAVAADIADSPESAPKPAGNVLAFGARRPKKGEGR